MKILIFMILLLCLTLNAGSAEDKMFSIGIGGGGAYGFIGANFDYCVIPNLNLFLAAGARPYSGVPYLGYDNDYEFGWAAGLRYHLLSAANNFRPRISVYYGVNSYLKFLHHYEDGRVGPTFSAFGKGFSVGTGLKWMFGRSKTFGFDFDLYYAITSESYLQEKYKKQNPVIEKKLIHLSFGFRYAFDI